MHIFFLWNFNLFLLVSCWLPTNVPPWSFSFLIKEPCSDPVEHLKWILSRIVILTVVYWICCYNINCTGCSIRGGHISSRQPGREDKGEIYNSKHLRILAVEKTYIWVITPFTRHRNSTVGWKYFSISGKEKTNDAKNPVITRRGIYKSNCNKVIRWKKQNVFPHINHAK